MTTTEKLARYETAIEILGMMTAMRSAWIHEERHKNTPDESMIGCWEDEQMDFSLQDQTLRFSDSTGIERVIAEYGPIVKAAFKG